MSGISGPVMLTCSGCGKKWMESAYPKDSKIICPECEKESNKNEPKKCNTKLKKKK